MRFWISKSLQMAGIHRTQSSQLLPAYGFEAHSCRGHKYDFENSFGGYGEQQNNYTMHNDYDILVGIEMSTWAAPALEINHAVH